jgi:hypothetical protein
LGIQENADAPSAAPDRAPQGADTIQARQAEASKILVNLETIVDSPGWENAGWDNLAAESRNDY